MCVYLGYAVPVLMYVFGWVGGMRTGHVCVHWSLQVQILARLGPHGVRAGDGRAAVRLRRAET